MSAVSDAVPNLAGARWRDARRVILSPPVLIGATLIVLLIAMAALAPILAPMDPDRINPGNRLAKPGAPGYLLGTDQLGRDILSRLFWGARVSLAAGLSAAALSMLVGVIVGIAAGMGSPTTDNLLMRAVDVLLAFPAILLAVLIVAVLGPGIRNAMLAVAIVNVPFYARISRGVALSTREKEFIEAARAVGSSRFRIVWSHVLPNAIPYILVTATLNVGWMITETAALSFLGLGAQPPTADWGTMLGDGRNTMGVAPHVATIPGIAIFLVVVAFNLVGDGLRDAFDPRRAA